MRKKNLIKNIKEYYQEEKNKIKEYIKENFEKAPSIAIIQVGNNEASNKYIKNKKKDCEEVGIDFQWYGYEEEITTKDLIIEIQDLLPYVDGMLVQMPLPDHIDETAIKEIIPPHKDLDGFHLISYLSCIPFGIINYLEKECNFDENGKLIGNYYNTEYRDITPIPGEVELLTRLALLENAVSAANMQREG